MKELLETTAQRAIRYLEGLESRSVAPLPDAIAKLERFHETLPNEPTDPLQVIAMLDEIGSPATMAIAGSRFFGFVIGGSLPAALAANWLAATWDQNSALYNVTPTTAELEAVAAGWLLKMLGLPPNCGVGFVTGATAANFTALAAARHAILEQQGWNVEADGLFGAPPITVVIGDEAHPTLLKSLGLIGFGRNRVIRVPTDAQGRMRADALPKLTSSSLVCTQAGNVNTGAFDPIHEVCDRAQDAGTWVHVDGAFGLWAAVATSRKYLVPGLERADSWATDAHKWLNVPYDSGLAFVRDANALRGAMAITADFTPELSRRARGVEVWAALRSLGQSGLSELIERTCRHARRFAQGFEAAGYRVLNEVVLNQVLVSFGDAAMTNRVISQIQRDGTCWCGITVWQGQTAMGNHRSGCRAQPCSDAARRRTSQRPSGIR
jgi:glutamate/tyrosine decarboxylase-like PLP-dependent enzyme